MPRKRRPTVILFMAILNMVMGGFTLLCGLCAAGANSFVAAMGANPQGPGGAGVADMTTFMDKEVPGWQAVEIGRGLLLILLGVVVIVAGIGLLKMQSWARWLSVFYAAVLIPLTIGHLTFELALVNPAVEKWEAQQDKKGIAPAPPPSFKAGQQFGKTFGAVALGSIPVLYAVALIIVMLLPSVGTAFAPPSRRRAREEEEDLDDEDDNDRDDRRRPRRRDLGDHDDEDDNPFRRRPHRRDYDDD
jgi:hypothetical protein